MRKPWVFTPADRPLALLYLAAMRLARWHRIVLTLVGACLIALGCVGTAKGWSGVGLTTLIVAGLFVFVGALVGVVPGGSLKEGTLEWPEVDKHPRIEAVESRSDALTQQVRQLEESQTLLRNVLIDLILANEPPPNDGIPDEERLRDWRHGYLDLDQEISSRLYTGEDYDDGVSTQQLKESLVRGREDLYREERRQAARILFRKVPDPGSLSDEWLLYTPPGHGAPSPVEALLADDPVRQHLAGLADARKPSSS